MRKPTLMLLTLLALATTAVRSGALPSTTPSPSTGLMPQVAPQVAPARAALKTSSRPASTKKLAVPKPKLVEAKPIRPSQPRSQTPKAQALRLRGLWVDAFGPGFKTPQEVDKLVRDAQAMGINVLFAQVSRRMDCYCNLASMPRTADPAVPAGFDPLAQLLERAHAVGIQVHAWIITTAAWSSAAPVAANDHPFLLHGPKAKGRENWLTQQQNGETKAGPDQMFDPGHPDAADFIARMYASVVENYAVDGVQLDRVRYPDSGGPPHLPVWGYNPTALERFQRETGRDDMPNALDAQWTQWRRDQITNLVRRVFLEVKRIRPEVWVSAATITYREAPMNLEQFDQTRTQLEVLQDWPAWLREGILDLNVPMNYKREQEPDQAAWFDGWNNFATLYKSRARVAVGTAHYLNAPNDGLNQLKRVLDTPGSDGWVLYSYRTPDNAVYAGRKSSQNGQKQLLEALSALNATPSTWDVAPTEHLNGVFGRVTRNGVGQSGLPLELRSNGAAVQLFTDANGYYGLADAGSGELSLRAPSGEQAMVIVVPGKVQTLNLELR